MTTTENLLYARADLNAAADLVSLLRLAEAVEDVDHVELDAGAALRAAMRLAVEIKEAAGERFEQARREYAGG